MARRHRPIPGRLFLLPFLLYLFQISQSQDASPIPPPQTLTLTSLEAVQHAVTLHNAGQTSSALTTLTTVTESAPTLQEGWFYLAAVQQQSGLLSLSLSSYATLLTLNPNHIDALNNIGKALSDLSDPTGSLSYYMRALTVDPNHVQTLVNVALSYHAQGDGISASRYHELALTSCGNSCALLSEVRYNYGVTLQHLGSVERAVEMYRLAIEARAGEGKEHGSAWVNLAAMHHKYGNLDDAIWHYERARKAVAKEGGEEEKELEVMILNNLGQALAQAGRVKEAKGMFNAVLSVLGSGERDERLTTMVHRWRAGKMNCDWEEFGHSVEGVMWEVLERQVDEGKDAALLPFDTLGMEIPKDKRRDIAVNHARALSELSSSMPPPLVERPAGRLKLGYICYDFNDHPTSHLAEGLFLHHNKTGRVEVTAMNYGKDDESTYRKNIVELVGGKEEDGGR